MSLITEPLDRSYHCLLVFLCDTLCVYLLYFPNLVMNMELERAFGPDTTTKIVAYAWLSIVVGLINFVCNE